MSNKSLLLETALIVSGFLGASAAAQADGARCYTLASLQGTYAIVGDYGAHIAIALGLRHFDGNGNFTATFLVNEPTAGSTTGARTLVTGTQTETYTINCDGTGVMTRILSTTNGITATGMDDFLVTGATTKDWHLIATTIVDAQRTPSAIVAGGVFLTRTYTRLPDTSE